MGVNITEVRLLSVPLEKDYKHTLWFASQGAQLSYFGLLPGRTLSRFNYIRKDNFISVDAKFDDLLKYNYVMYKNAAYSDKWFFAFITKTEYVNDNCTYLYIETDVLQTWMFDYTVKPSFIEREHVDNDAIGAHTVPETLEIGEYIINGSERDNTLKPASALVMGSTIVPSDLGKSIGGVYNGLYSGVKYYAYPTDGANGINTLSQLIQSVTDEYDDGAISSLFLAPEFVIPGFKNGGVVEQTQTPANYTYSVPKKYGLQGYTPRNNKLKTYPYTYLLVSNGNGSVAEYRYEFFDTDDCSFVVFGVLTPGCSIRMIPAIYKGVQLPEAEGLNLGKYPQCNWATDQYTNWLTQNGVNIATGLINGAVGGVQGAVMGAGAGSVIPGVGTAVGTVVGGVTGAIGGFSQIAGTLNEVHKAQMAPPQTQGNINCGDVVTARGDNTFTYYHMSIREEFARIVDGFFDMYGYKCNRVKIPNENHRQNYWFTKCIDVNVDGAIPQGDLQTIKACYNNGVTFWKNPDNIGNYAVANAVI